MLGLPCCRPVLSSCGAWDSPCGGLSCRAPSVGRMRFSSCTRGLRDGDSQPQSAGSAVAATGLVAPWHTIPGSRMEPLSPATGRRILYHWTSRAALFLALNDTSRLSTQQEGAYWVRVVKVLPSSARVLPRPVPGLASSQAVGNSQGCSQKYGPRDFCLMLWACEGVWDFLH